MSGAILIEPLVRRLLPAHNPDPAERAHAWNDWIAAGGCTPLCKFIRWANGTSAEDDEILQETLITAYIKVEQGAYTPRDVPFSAFLKTIARFKILEAARRHGKHVSLDALPDDLFADESSSHDAADTWKEQEALQTALRKLPPRRSHIVIMYERGYTTAEIATQLGIGEALVRKEKSLGLRQLRQSVQFALAG
ncbi:MAG: sigma-70 family RNA polymerase sigma factor [Anaerolineae bacterium]|nr:sigma-70 family RNA polymerase sigma factor [Anaerolineae bacterium]